MAKVYDALEAGAGGTHAPVTNGGREASKGCRGRRPTFTETRLRSPVACNGELGDNGEPERVAHERLETIIGRLMPFENLASKKFPELERNLLQLVRRSDHDVEREGVLPPPSRHSAIRLRSARPRASTGGSAGCWARWSSC